MESKGPRFFCRLTLHHFIYTFPPQKKHSGQTIFKERRKKGRFPQLLKGGVFCFKLRKTRTSKK